MHDRVVAFHLNYLGQNIKLLLSSDTENFYSKSYYQTLLIVGTMYYPLQQIDFNESC